MQSNTKERFQQMLKPILSQLNETVETFGVFDDEDYTDGYRFIIDFNPKAIQMRKIKSLIAKNIKPNNLECAVVRIYAYPTICRIFILFGTIGDRGVLDNGIIKTSDNQYEFPQVHMYNA